MTKLLCDWTPYQDRERKALPGEFPIAIYLTSTGEEYCRDSLDYTSNATHPVVAAGARSHFHRIADAIARQQVDSFRIEWRSSWT